MRGRQRGGRAGGGPRAAGGPPAEPPPPPPLPPAATAADPVVRVLLPLRSLHEVDTDSPTGGSDVTRRGLAAAWDAARHCRLLRLRQVVRSGYENRERGLGHVQHELRRRPVLTLDRDQRGEREKP